MAASLQIIVPYYRGSEYLRATCESVARQTCNSWSLTVVDDAGPDDDAESVLRETFSDAQRRDCVRLLRHTTNQGIARTFNHALQLATDRQSTHGTWLTILGSDDLLHPSYVATILSAASAASRSTFAIQPGVSVIDQHGLAQLPLADRVKAILRPPAAGYLDGQYLAASLALGNWLYFPSLAWHLPALGGRRFSPALHTAMDLDFIFQHICAGQGIQCVAAKVFSYRRHQASASSQTRTSGSRFAEEQRLYSAWSTRFTECGWHVAAATATIHPTSRLHAWIGKVNY